VKRTLGHVTSDIRTHDPRVPAVKFRVRPAPRARCDRHVTVIVSFSLSVIPTWP